jgi:hypothetical protein
MKLDFYISHNYTQRYLVLHPSTTTTAATAATTTTPEAAAAAAATTITTSPAAAATTTTIPAAATTPTAAAATTPTAAAATTPAAATADAVDIPPKTRYKQKQNEIHYQNSTHVIHLTLSKVEIPSFEYYTTHPKTP